MTVLSIGDSFEFCWQSLLLIILAQKIHCLVPILPHKAVVGLLLEKGANLESKDDDSGDTLLLSAATYRHEAIVKLLLENGTQTGV
jgi:ankyrin repeat protein